MAPVEPNAPCRSASAGAGPRTGAAGVSVRSQLAIAKIVARYKRARPCCGDAFINGSYR